VDSAKTEESKYWFPSHARKRSENINADHGADLLMAKGDAPREERLILNIMTNLDLGDKMLDEATDDQQICRIRINSIRSSLSNA
jgi:hypothetical protein